MEHIHYDVDELETIRRGVFGAFAAVSAAKRGFLAGFREIEAAARVISAAPPAVRDLLDGAVIEPVSKHDENFDAEVVPGVQAAVRIAAAKDPATAEQLRQLILDGIGAVAEAYRGIDPAEQRAIDAIRAGLG